MLLHVVPCLLPLRVAPVCGANRLLFGYVSILHDVAGGRKSIWRFFRSLLISASLRCGIDSPLVVVYVTRARVHCMS